MINRKIEYFLTLAECLNFTQAAARHNVSQTAVSQYIASLEDRLEVKLFNRTPHAVTMTEAGRYYYEQITKLLRSYDDTLVNIKNIAAGYHGYIKVGIGVYEYCSTEFLFSRFLAAHPEIKVDILQYPYSELAEKLRTRELDVIIGPDFCQDFFARKELTKRVLFRSSNYLAVHPDIAARYPSGDIREILMGECLITNCEDDGPSSLNMLYNLLKDAVGFVPNRIEQTNSVNAQLMMVRAGHGVAIVPDFVIDSQPMELIRYELPSDMHPDYQLMKLKKNINEAADLLMDFPLSEGVQG